MRQLRVTFRVSWAVGVVAPWCLGIGLVLSIPAGAGQDSVIGASLAPTAFLAAAQPSDLVPITGGTFGLNEEPDTARLVEAKLVLGESRDFTQFQDEIEPRTVFKREAQHRVPEVVRSHKGDPFVGLRPTFDTNLRRKGGFESLRAQDLIYQHDETLPMGAFSSAEEEIAGPDSVESFEPWPDGETPTSTRSPTDVSPRQGDLKGGGSVITMRPAAINERLQQGATPSIPRAAALASTTPAPAENTPVEIVALAAVPKGFGTLSAPNVSMVPAARPNYAALIDQDQAAREKRCLAEAIYFEARSEPEQGQAAVAQVVLNRVSSGLYPSSICGVVYQNRRRYHACQFSFACEGRSLRVTEQDAWRNAVRIADEVSEGKTYLADVGGSTHYHANYVRPGWARRLKKMDVIGHHIFYQLRPGQT